MAAAKAFAKENGMAEDADLLGRASLVARDPEGFMHETSIDEVERNALEYEYKHKWHGPKMLW